jgi:hypothetical protein
MKTAAPHAEATPETDAKVTRSRRWPRVPTSVIVTLIGIGLSAWLIPAFTRQWDDRQKARDLKADLVAQMASATATAVVAAHRLAPDVDRYPVEQPAGEQWLDAQDAWLLANLRLQARLRTYFSDSVVAEWANFREYVNEYFFLPGSSLGDKDIESLKKFRGGLLRMRLDPERAAELVDEWRSGGYWGANEDAGLSLLDNEAAIAARVLDAHTTGYSTTARDLINDLLPF